MNNLEVDRNIRVVGFTWGLFLNRLSLIEPIDYILGSDCFYESSAYEDVLISVSYILDNNPSAVFLCAYQERSSDWSIEHLLAKWNLKCQIINTSNLGKSVGLDLYDLTGPHTIHLFEISRF